MQTGETAYGELTTYLQQWRKVRVPLVRATVCCSSVRKDVMTKGKVTARTVRSWIAGTRSVQRCGDAGQQQVPPHLRLTGVIGSWSAPSGEPEQHKAKQDHDRVTVVAHLSGVHLWGYSSIPAHPTCARSSEACWWWRSPSPFSCSTKLFEMIWGLWRGALNCSKWLPKDKENII